ncbi:MAG: hypothetical protein FD183_1651 [Chitinophagaceae bacterium]|nr:MAG: hypothetical protein FD183_1651 [Chitinophagaceae bacterium]
MKYFFSVLFSIVLLNVAIAQDYKKITTLQVLGKTEESKVEIDKMAADPKAQGKAETWYWKSKIYAAINKNEALRAKYPTIAKDADDAFKKYLEMDPAFALVKEKGAEGFFDMYKCLLFTVIIFSKINGLILRLLLIQLLFYMRHMPIRMHKKWRMLQSIITV